ncbi:hypothetical protein FACS189429_6080 [Bacteroidia bacterium]|nr:hypothetical protein FACS189429_6080 [Bacteroidia bacterium]
MTFVNANSNNLTYYISVFGQCADQSSYYLPSSNGWWFPNYDPWSHGFDYVQPTQSLVLPPNTTGCFWFGCAVSDVVIEVTCEWGTINFPHNEPLYSYPMSYDYGRASSSLLVEATQDGNSYEYVLIHGIRGSTETIILQPKRIIR